MKLDFLKQPYLFGADRMLADFLKPDDLCFTIQEEIAPKIKLEDFEDMYKGGGRPPMSPKILLLVLILQYLERLSDRAAAYNLRYRLDWKIVFGLELDFKGIHPTTLVYFRDRLIESKKASYAFDKVLEHLKSIGLIKKGATQRIDSTHIIGSVRELGRLELFHDTLRLFCEDILSIREFFNPLIQERVDFYSEDISIRGISDLQKAKYISEAGLAMKVLIDWVRRSPEPLKIKDKSTFKTLVTVFEQNFIDINPDPDGEPKLIKIATGKDHISSPHEPEARYASKGNKSWLGYKAQVAETVGEVNKDEKNNVNFITFIDVQDATDHDGTAIAPYIESQKKNDILPSEVYGDTHYNSSSNIEALIKEGVDLKGPVAPVPSKIADEKNQGFKVDLERKKVVCPEGKESKTFATWQNGKIAGSFHEEHCRSCNSQDICKPEKRGKRIALRAESELLIQRRALMETDEFKKEMHKRNGIEGTLSGIVRGQGMRRSRFRGKEKTRLQLKFSGAAANISRLHRKNVANLAQIQKNAA